MDANSALSNLKPEVWAATSPRERLNLLYEIRKNLTRLGDKLAASDSAMKNTLIGADLYPPDVSKVATVMPMAGTVTAAIQLYSALHAGHTLRPRAIRKVGETHHDVDVFPTRAQDRMLYGARLETLRVTGAAQQTSPMDKPAEIIAVLGAGNYSSALEMLKAIFFENCAVVHKPHHLNAQTDMVWAEIMAPLVRHGVLAFTEHDQGRALTQDPRVSKIYFTGGTETAKAITSASNATLVSECGGNNPILIVPGDRPWTAKEMEHQAQQIVTIGKLNGGAVCGRGQTLITAKDWGQREEFLDAIRKAVVEDTPAEGTYYPGSDAVVQSFLDHYPNAERLQPEGGKYPHTDMVFIPGVETDGFAACHEAFCQILVEIPLDAPVEADGFLREAVAYANTKILGTLACAILIDEDTRKAHGDALDQAVTDLRYGAIAVNTMPPFVFLSPWLTWGGNEEGQPLVSGYGNFGNGMNFANVEKSIISDAFMSPGHMITTNKAGVKALSAGMAAYALNPSWGNLFRLMATAIGNGFRSKDF